MKCPILHPDGETTEHAIIAIPQDCLQTDCAWWEGLGEVCAILSLAVDAGNLRTEMFALGKYLRKEGEV